MNMLKPVINISQFKYDVIKSFESISKDNPLLRQFIYGASTLDSVFIVGGFLRSVANREKPRDLDIIFNTSGDALIKYIQKWNLEYSKNKFGGFKVDFRSIIVDIWTSDTNWAFESKVVDVGDEHIISKVAQGTFFNYDSLVFDLKTEKVNVTNYNHCVTNRRLDIIRKDSRYSQKNPGKISNVARAFKIRHKYGLQFSDNLCRYIYNEFITLGIYDVDKMVSHLYEFVSAKRSGKYKELENEDIIRSYFSYILNILEGESMKGESQMRLFNR